MRSFTDLKFAKLAELAVRTGVAWAGREAATSECAEALRALGVRVVLHQRMPADQIVACAAAEESYTPWPSSYG